MAKDELETKVRERTAELQRSNLEIQESERQLRILTEAIPQQIWRADSLGRVEYCNQHLRDYVGAGESSLAGDSFSKSFTGKIRHSSSKAMGISLGRGRPRQK